MKFENFKENVIKKFKDKSACQDEFKRVIAAKDFKELLAVLFDNKSWVFLEAKILTYFDIVSLGENVLKDSGITFSVNWNSGHLNSGDRNSGDWNSGHLNSGDRNSGDLNSGNLNSGDRNSGGRNSGDLNSGDLNSGNRNSGNRNSGGRNSGDLNSGDLNSGNRNSGNRNSGGRNSGNRNSGNWNSGDLNSGNRNSGNRNSGNRNSGHLNSGNWNSGNRNSGHLNSNSPSLRLFNRETDKKKEDIYFPNWLHFELAQWVYSENMTKEEKNKNPYHETCGGYLKVKGFKEAAQEKYNAATKEEQRSIEDIPNYDANVLFEIFGIDRRQ